MKKLFALIAVCLFAGNIFAQSEGGIIQKSSTGAAEYTPWNESQALNAMTQPYTCKMADSTAATVSTKYGTRYRLCRIANVSGTGQRIVASTLNTTDTIQIYIDAYSVSERLPFIRRVISGAVADSTRYDFLYK
jgi:hypothetical protein